MNQCAKWLGANYSSQSLIVIGIQLEQYLRSSTSTCWCTSSWSMCVRYSRPGGHPGMRAGRAIHCTRFTASANCSRVAAQVTSHIVTSHNVHLYIVYICNRTITYNTYQNMYTILQNTCRPVAHTTYCHLIILCITYNTFSRGGERLIYVVTQKGQTNVEKFRLNYSANNLKKLPNNFPLQSNN